MITTNNFQDIQIIQDADFVNTITFDSEYVNTLYDYSARIAKDKIGTPFTWGGNTATYVAFTIAYTDDTTLTLTLDATTTAKFADDFEGVWDLISRKDVGAEIVREIEGDVVVSAGVTPKTATFTSYQ